DLPDTKLQKILPGVMAEYLAGNVDNVHISIIKKLEKGRYLIGVCDHAIMMAAKEMAAKKGRIIKSAWPDYALINVPESGIALYNDGERILARRSDETGFCVNINVLDHVVKAHQTHEAKPDDEFPEGFGLASGKYSPRAPIMAYIRPAYRFGLISLAGLIIWTISMILMISDNEAKRREYADASTQIFKKTYPDVKRIVNVEAQMRTMTSVGDAGSGQEFLSLSETIFKAVSQAGGVRLDSLSFDKNDGEPIMNITIISENYAEATSFESMLENAGLNVTQGDSSQDGTMIFSRFIITGGV
ncbi:MAG TPA: type II secretion system protein GspL, partial [Emcibacteraceae bacterium]|nr:type II secretion system protein GspL [Emcibacteraceae bacterium]